MPKNNDFNKIETQAQIIKQSLTNLLNYYHKSIATEKEKENSENDKAMIDGLVEAMKANGTISEINPETEKFYNSQNRFSLERNDIFFEKDIYDINDAFYDPNKPDEEQVGYNENIYRVLYAQVGAIIRLIDQVAVRLEYAKSENPEERPSFSEMILASAITAAKLSDEYIVKNTSFLNEWGYLNLFLIDYKNKMSNVNRINEVDLDHDKIINKIEESRMDDGQGLLDNNKAVLLGYLLDRKDRVADNNIVFTDDVGVDISCYLERMGMGLEASCTYSNILLAEFNKIATNIYPNYLLEAQSDSHLLKRIEHAHLQAMGFIDNDKSIDLPLDEKQLYKRLTNALSCVDYKNLLALKQGLDQLPVAADPTVHSALIAQVLNVANDRLKAIHEQIKDNPALQAKQSGQMVKREYLIKKEAAKPEMDSDSEVDQSNVSPRKN